MDSNQEVINHRAHSLFTYLRELAQLGSAITRHWSEYEETIWLHEIPDAPEVRRMAWRDADAKEQPQLWLEIKKPELKDPPRVPAEVKPWLEDTAWRDCDCNEPSLRPSIRLKKIEVANTVERRTSEQVLILNDHPEILSSWRKYVEERWKPWAVEETKRRSIQRIYESLFSFFLKQRQEPERYEVVVAQGLLAWAADGKPEIHRHIVTAQANLMFESVLGIISMSAAGEGAKLILEQDMLDEPLYLKGESLEPKLAEIGDAIWDKTKMGEVLKTWINWLSPRGRYHESFRPQDKLLEFPTIHLAPAVILRRRGEKGYLTILREILEEIENGVQVPQAVQSLIGTYEEQQNNADPAVSSPDEIYFPKPSNEEQEKIVYRLNDRHGLVVQGPPGTGKSHTIANLVCHLLAMGKRVLVTSHSPRALRVLRDKFPPEVAPLCIMLLDDDRQALKELEESVGHITRSYDNWNQDENYKLINDLEHQLDQTRAEKSNVIVESRIVLTEMG